MLIHQSKLLGKTRRQAPADAETPSHKLLTRAGFIDQLASGIFSLLPLGYLAQANVERIVREEMVAIGATELLLPALQSAALWAESGRLNTMDPPLFRLQDRHKKELVLGSTHEEVITDLARKHIESYKDLPVALFQIQTKFRNELRATGGLLRVREFQMKDLYSFHRSTQDLHTYYNTVQKAYQKIFQRCDLRPVHVVLADSGSIGGAVSHEFSVEVGSGEDRVALCPECGFAANIRVTAKHDNTCPNCSAVMEIKACIENGHTFQLGTKYSEKLGAFYNEEDGSRKPIIMGCYGIGIGRLLATIVETHHDDAGMRWPAEISPLPVHLLGLQPTVAAAARRAAEAISQKISVLYDDRPASPGEKLADADLLGLNWRVIVSEKTGDKVEIKERRQEKSQLMTVDQFLTTAAANRQ